METLCSFKLVWQSGLEVKMDDGKLRRFEACRVWHRSPFVDQPHKGGDRWHPNVSVEVMKPHSMEMSWKIWLAGIEMGGAKGGIAVDPETLSLGEQKRLTEASVDERDERNILGPRRDVPAPDVGTNSQIMHWVRQRYAHRHRVREDGPFAGVVTGKPVGYGFDGIEGRTEATGFGVMHVLDRVMSEHWMPYPRISTPRLAVMGFGNVGSHIVQRAAQRQYPVIAVSDKNGGVYASGGLDLQQLFAYYKENRTFSDFKGGDRITNDELLVLQDIDVLFPAALEHVLTKANAARVGAKIIGEGANSPTTFEADKIFEDRGIIVIPDICANAGGVIVSFFEWARNMNVRDERVPCGEKDAVLSAMEAIMSKSTAEMCANAEKYKTSLRNAALVTALGRVAPLFVAKHTA